MIHIGRCVLLHSIWLLAVVFEVKTTVTIHSVGSLQDTGSIQCGSKVTFICSIPTYMYTMTWSIDSDIVAACTTTHCVPNPPYKFKYVEFSNDTTTGEFNMTINPVTFEANGHELKCEDGSEAVIVTLAVKVFPKEGTGSISNSKDNTQGMINITAVTGCVFPSSAITMQWYFYKAGQAPKLYNMSPPIDAMNASACTPGVCGGIGVVQMTSSLSIPDVKTGREYYFQVIIKHKDAYTKDIVYVDSYRAYRIGLTRPADIEEENSTNIGLIVGLSVGLPESIVLLFVGTYCLYRSYRN